MHWNSILSTMKKFTCNNSTLWSLFTKGIRLFFQWSDPLKMIMVSMYVCIHTPTQDMYVCAHTPMQEMYVCAHTPMQDMYVCVHTPTQDIYVCIHTLTQIVIKEASLHQVFSVPRTPENPWCVFIDPGSPGNEPGRVMHPWERKKWGSGHCEGWE